MYKTGYLVKQGGRYKSWKRRWFVLHKDHLSYFAKSEDIAPKGTILLDGTSVLAAPKEINKPFCFQIYHPSRRVYFIHASNEREMLSWMEAIQTVRDMPPESTNFDEYREPGNSKTLIRNSGSARRSRKVGQDLRASQQPSGSWSETDLMATELADQRWLRLSDQSLNNDTLLADLSIYLTSELAMNADTAAMAVDEEDELDRLNRSMMLGIVEDANTKKVDQWTETLRGYGNQLEKLSMRQASFSQSFVKKRLRILERIHLAIARNRARDNLRQDDASSLFRTSSSVTSSMHTEVFGKTTRTLMSGKPEAAASGLDTLQAFLKDVKPLTMANEPGEVVLPFIDWLGALMRNEKLKDSLRLSALNVMLGLTLARGSLVGLLQVVETLCLASPKQAKAFNKLRCVPYIRSLAKYRLHAALPSLNARNFTTSFFVALDAPLVPERMVPFSEHVSMSGSIASDGTYLYIHDRRGLLKVGTGYRNTLAGKVYASLDDFHVNATTSSLGVVNGMLYFRAAQLAPATLEVVDTAKFKSIGLVNAKGNGSAPSSDNSKYDFTPSNQPMCCDGEFLYFIKSDSKGAVRVDMYEPARKMALVRQILLQANPGSGAVITPDAVTQGTFYTNGVYLMFLLPPRPSEAMFRRTTFMYRLFSLRDGTVRDTFREPAPLGLPTCYDMANNVLWNYNSYGLQVSLWANSGAGVTLAAIGDATKSGLASIDSMDAKAPLPREEVVGFLLQKLLALTMQLEPAIRETQSKNAPSSLTAPYTIEVSRYVFEMLYDLLDQTSSRFKLDASQLVPFFKLLKLNLHRLVVSRIPAVDVGLSDKAGTGSGSKTRNLVWSFRQLLRQYATDPRKVVEVTDGTLSMLLQQEASEALTIGLLIFFPSPTERGALLQQLMQDVAGDDAKRAQSMPLMRHIMRSMAHLPDLYMLVLPPGRSDTKQERVVFGEKLLKQLMFVVTRLKIPEALELLRMIQSDMINRCVQIMRSDLRERNVNDLIFYAKLVMDQASSILAGNSKSGDVISLDNFDDGIVQVILPTLVTALSGFATNLTVASRVLNAVTRLVQLLDDINTSHYSAFQTSKLYASQDLLGEHGGKWYRVVESPHSYINNMDTWQTVTIPGATYLSLQFDPKCSTEPGDQVVVYEPAPNRKRRLGEPLSGPSVCWPKGRILVPGDSVIFNFVSRVNRKAEWGFRCVVLGHHSPYATHGMVQVASTSQSSINMPEMIKLQKTCVVLAAACTATLVRGEFVGEDEAVPAAVIEKSIFKEGLEQAVLDEEAANEPVEPQDMESEAAVSYKESISAATQGARSATSNATMNGFSDKNAPSAKTRGHDRGGSHSSRGGSWRSGEGSARAASAQDSAAMAFCKDFVEDNANTRGAEVLKFVVEYFEEDDDDSQRGDDRGMSPQDVARFVKAERFVGAALLKHSGLAHHLVGFTQTAEWQDARTNPDLDVDEGPRVIRGLVDAWEPMSKKLRRGIIKKHQEFMLSVYRDGGESKPYNDQTREDSYDQIVTEIINKARLLLNVSVDPVNRGSYTLLQGVVTSVVELVLSPVSSVSLRRMYATRRKRAQSRLRGYQLMDELLESVAFPTMRHEILFFYGVALKTNDNDSIWNHHYLDNLAGAGITVIRPIQRLFVSLMKRLLDILQTSNSDPVTQQMSLLPWGIRFSPDDHRLLVQTSILATLSKWIVDPVHVVITMNGGSVKRPFCLRDYDKSVCYQCAETGEEEMAGDSYNSAETEQVQKTTLRDMAWNAFALLGATAVGPPSDGTPMPKTENLFKKPIHATFFKLMISELSKGARNERLFNVVSLLYLVCDSAVGASAISDPSFLSRMVQLLHPNAGIPHRIRRLLVAVLRRVLPVLHPDMRVVDGSGKKKPLVITLIDVMGATYLTPECPLLQVPVRTELVTSSTGGSAARIPYQVARHLASSFPVSFDPRSTVGPGAVYGTYLTQLQYLAPSASESKRRALETWPLFLVRSNKVVPDASPMHYCELTINKTGDTEDIVLGLVPETEPLDGMPGEHNGSYGWHGDDGQVYSFHLDGIGEKYAAPFANGDVVGQFWNRRDGTVFYTKNGKYLGTAFRNVFGAFHVVVGMASRGADVACNFGQKPFKFDVKGAAVELRMFPHTVMNVWKQQDNLDDIGDLLRGLLARGGWSDSIPAAMWRFLGAVKKYYGKGAPKKDKMTQEAVNIIAVMNVLGGSIEHLRIGAPVDVEVNQTEDVVVPGHVIDYDFTATRVKVTLDSESPPSAKVFPRQDVIPRQQFDLNWEKLRLTGELIESWIPLLRPIDDKVLKDTSPSAAMTYYVHMRARALKTLLRIVSHSNNVENVTLALLTALMKLATHPLPAREPIDIATLEMYALQLREEIRKSEHLKTILKLGEDAPAVLSAKPSKDSGKRTMSGGSIYRGAGSRRKSNTQGTVQVARDLLETKKEEEEVTRLVKQESITQEELLDIKSMFTAYDIDKSGGISAKEYFHAVEAFKGGITEADVKEFRKMDRDKNALVSFVEFLQFMVRKRRAMEMEREADAIMLAEKEPKNPLHPGVRCRMCSKRVKGARYKNLNMVDLDVCVACEASSKEVEKLRSQGHVFMKILRPLPTPAQCDPELRGFLYPRNRPLLADTIYESPGYESDTSDPSSPLPPMPVPGKAGVHQGVVCQNCGADPIKGHRMKCVNCRDDFSLCPKCEHVAPDVHDRSHVFAKIVHPLPSDQCNPASLYFPVMYVTYLRFKDVHRGMWLQVSEPKDIPKRFWNDAMDRTINSIGLVIKLDAMAEQVLLKIYDVDSSQYQSWWFHYRLLRLPNDELDKFPLNVLRGRLISTENMLAVLYARQAMVTVLGQPTLRCQFSLPSLGGMSQLVEFFRASIIGQNRTHEVGDSWNRRCSPALRRFLSRVEAYLKQDIAIGAMRSNAFGSTDAGAAAATTSAKAAGAKAAVMAAAVRWRKNARGKQKTLATTAAAELGSSGSKSRRRKESSKKHSEDRYGSVKKHRSKEERRRSSKSREKSKSKSAAASGSMAPPGSGSVVRERRLRGDEILAASTSARIVRDAQSKGTPPPVAHVLVTECLRNLALTAHQRLPVIVEESEHPVRESDEMFAKMVRVEGAQALLVHFDPRCDIDIESDALGFYRSATVNESFGAFNGTGFKNYPDVIIPANRFWMLFRCRSTKRKWGYRFYVTPLRMRLTDRETLRQPDADFGLFLAEWLLSLEPVWMEPIYVSEIVDVLLQHLKHKKLLDRRMRIVNILTQLVRRTHLFRANNSTPPNLGKLKSLRNELFALHVSEDEQNGADRYFSRHVKRLTELVIECDLLSNGKFAHTSSSNVDPSLDWLVRAVEATRVVRQLQARRPLTDRFVVEACNAAKREVYVEESLHPYPGGVNMSGSIDVPSAKRLVVKFDELSHLLMGDYLMFSKASAGKDDLGCFSGKFPSDPLVLNTSHLVWTLQSSADVSVAAGHTAYGFRFTVTPEYSKDASGKQAAHYAKLAELANRTKSKWTLQMDQALVSFINDTADARAVQAQASVGMPGGVNEALQLQFRHADADQLPTQPLIGAVPVDEVEARFVSLRHANLAITSLLPYVDMAPLNERWSTAWKLSSLRGVVLYTAKTSWLFEYLKNSEVMWGKVPVHVSRAVGSPSLFLQALMQLNDVSPTYLKRSTPPLEVRFAGEDVPSGDAFRELMGALSRDVQRDKSLGLFVPVKNASSTAYTGDNTDQFVPNPLARSPAQLEQFKFIGKLIGVALRTRQTLEFDFPSLVWKQFVGLQPEFEDLEAIDAASAQFLTRIRQDDGDLREYNFEELIDARFETQDVRGDIVELKVGGSQTQVTWRNRKEYAALVQAHRLSEFDAAVRAMRSGIDEVLEPQILSIFTHQELEFSVCGRRGVDVDSMMRHTQYIGLRAEDSVVRDFWSVLSSWGTSRRRALIQLVFARSRLPAGDQWQMPFRLQRMVLDSKHSKVDHILPEAHSRSWTLELPEYTSRKVLARQLLVAVNEKRDVEVDYLRIDSDDDDDDDIDDLQAGISECPVQ